MAKDEDVGGGGGGVTGGAYGRVCVWSASEMACAGGMGNFTSWNALTLIWDADWDGAMEERSEGRLGRLCSVGRGFAGSWSVLRERRACLPISCHTQPHSTRALQRRVMPSLNAAVLRAARSRSFAARWVSQAWSSAWAAESLVEVGMEREEAEEVHGPVE